MPYLMGDVIESNVTVTNKPWARILRWMFYSYFPVCCDLLHAGLV
jgi:hypothetical protein